MIDSIHTQAKGQMQKCIEALQKHLATIRTGRASPALLDNIRVDFYGTPSPLTQVANITSLDARTLVVKAWDKSILKNIEKAILESDIGISPVNDGETIRLSVPPLTEERRKEFVRQAKQKSEEAKVAIRNVRRDANEHLKQEKKDGSVSEDEEKRGLKQIQDTTDAFISQADEHFAKKEKDIMTI